MAHKIQLSFNEPEPFIWPARFHYGLLNFFRSKLYHFLVVFLVVLDIACIIADITLTMVWCSKHKPHAVEVLIEVFGWETVAVSSIFLLEHIFRLSVLGVGQLKRFLNLLDLFVVVASFTIAVILRTEVSESELEEIPGLLVALRLWRVYELFHAAQEAEHGGIHQLLHELKAKGKHLVHFHGEGVFGVLHISSQADLVHEAGQQQHQIVELGNLDKSH